MAATQPPFRKIGDPPITWTPAELAAFDRYTERLSSRDQMTRLSARLDIDHWIAKHGKAKCDAMHKHLLERDARRKARKVKR